MSAVLGLVAIAVSWLGIRLAEERQRLRMYATYREHLADAVIEALGLSAEQAYDPIARAQEAAQPARKWHHSFCARPIDHKGWCF